MPFAKFIAASAALPRCAIAPLFAVCVAGSAGALAQDGHKHGHGHGSGGHHHQRFDDPARWSKSFDDPARDKWQKPAEVISALALSPDARVADIGAGTGYFTVRLARAAPKGLVFAVDIEKKMVEHIAARARDQGLPNVRGVAGTDTSANLAEPVDLALMVNAYHHIENRTPYMQALKGSLKPDGRIAIIEARPEAERGPPKHFRMSVDKIDAEMKAAGFVRMARHDFLPRQNFLIYALPKP